MVDKKQKTLSDSRGAFARLEQEAQRAAPRPVPEEGTAEQPEKIKVKVLKRGTILNHHHLNSNTIVELTMDEINAMRERGIQLGSLSEGDEDREVFDHTQEPEAVTEDKPLLHEGGAQKRGS